MSSPSYEELLNYDVKEAIELKAKSIFDYRSASIKEKEKFEREYPLFIPNHPL